MNEKPLQERQINAVQDEPTSSQATKQSPEITVQQCLSPELEEKLAAYFENIQNLMAGIRGAIVSLLSFSLY